MEKTNWEEYDKIVAEQRAEEQRWRKSEEGQRVLAEQRERAEFIHNYIGAAPDHARGYYLGLTKMLAYASQFAKGDVYGIDVDPEDFGYGYSPSGEQRHAEHFYSPEPEAAPDLIRHTFDPVLFLCVAEEWDEMQLTAWNFELVEYKHEPVGLRKKWMTTYGLRITTACTESDTGVPDDFDGWYPWEQRARDLRDKLIELARSQ